MKTRILSGLLILPPFLFLLFWFFIPIRMRIVSIGNIAGAAFCVLVCLLWVFFPFIRSNQNLFRGFLILTALIGAGLIYVTILSVNMLISAWGNEVQPNPDEQRTVIVLGCYVDGNTPSIMLSRRLAAAREYLLADENAVCVVTGGQGPNEIRTEAGAMQEWLVNRGIAAERIFIEDESSSTVENFKFAYDVIIENNLPLNVIISSDGFHLWRAQMIAKEYFNVIGTTAAKTEAYLFPTYWVREWFSITMQLIR